MHDKRTKNGKNSNAGGVFSNFRAEKNMNPCLFKRLLSIIAMPPYTTLFVFADVKMCNI